MTTIRDMLISDLRAIGAAGAFRMMWRKTSEEQPEHLARVVVRAASGQEALARWAFGGWWIGGHPYDASLWPEWRPR